MSSTTGLSIIGGRLILESGPVSRPLHAADGLLTDSAPATGTQPADPMARTGQTVIDAEGLLVAPGFVDLQINGGFGIDLATDPAALWELGARLPAHGVTAFLPTIVSSPTAVVDEAMAAVAARPVGYRGAEPLGLHLEGPMLNPARAGAHRTNHLQPADRDLVEAWAGGGGVTMVTLAPELDGAAEVMAVLLRAGVVISGGHSDATASQAGAAADRGMTMVTHLFNAMSPLHHREPGLAALALTDDRLSAGLIVDGIHVDPVMVQLAWRAKGPTGLVLVTDAVAAMGLTAGTHQLGDRQITADNTGVRTKDGTLAGSNLTMDQAVRNLSRFCAIPVEQAVISATATPARVIGDNSRGGLDPGLRADLVLLNPEGHVVLTVCAGQVVYASPGQTWRFAP